MMVEVETGEKQRRLISEEEWQQPRIGKIFEVEMLDGRLKYNIQVTDVGRPSPFIDQYFSSEDAAVGLRDRVRDQSGGMINEERITEEAPKAKNKKSSSKESDHNGG